MSNRLTRPLMYAGSEAYVTLSQGKYAIIDADDAHLVDRWNWFARNKTYHTYAVRTDYSGPKQATVQMHAHILPQRPGFVVDHANGDTLDNRRSNLRYATSGQNKANSTTKKRRYPGLKGTRLTPDGKWVATISFEKKVTYLGSFNTTEDAHAAYCEAAVKLHGPFARFS